MRGIEHARRAPQILKSQSAPRIVPMARLPAEEPDEVKAMRAANCAVSVSTSSMQRYLNGDRQSRETRAWYVQCPGDARPRHLLTETVTTGSDAEGLLYEKTIPGPGDTIGPASGPPSLFDGFFPPSPLDLFKQHPFAGLLFPEEERGIHSGGGGGSGMGWPGSGVPRMADDSAVPRTWADVDEDMRVARGRGRGGGTSYPGFAGPSIPVALLPPPASKSSSRGRSELEV